MENHGEMGFHDRVVNKLCMRIAELEGRLAISESENEMIRAELKEFREKEENK